MAEGNAIIMFETLNLTTMLKAITGCSLLAVIVLGGCTSVQEKRLSATDSLLLAIDGQAYNQHLAVLSHDSLEGRKPFTDGETKTITYLSTEFAKLGLSPGNGDSYFQEVPLVEIDSKADGLLLRGPGQSLTLNYLDDFVAGSRRIQAEARVQDSEIVFVGYGIVAPEFGWDDYAGVDVSGKTVVVLVNDPGFADSTLFKGRNMTYYGRWTYKYEEASRQGAAAVLIVHDTAPASYGWNVVRSSWGKSKLYLRTTDNNQSRPLAEGWITMEAAQQLVALAGVSPDVLKQAGQKGFRPVPLDVTASVTIRNTITQSVSHNVLALWEGTDRKDEYLIYTAHWDHFGIGEAIDGDSIYNGAADNATGTAALLEIAKAFTQAPARPLRSILFLAVTSEEQGLLGSEYYATHPVYPVSRTVAAVNIDVLQPFGRMKDIIVVGKGQSELDEYIDDAAQKQDRYTRAEPDPSAGFYFRSDHFNFAKVGIPALYTETGTISREHGEAWGEAQKKAYNENRYHAPSDNYSPDWDLSGSIEDLRLLFDIGYTLGNEARFPKWKSGSEFKGIREQTPQE